MAGLADVHCTGAQAGPRRSASTAGSRSTSSSGRMPAARDGPPCPADVDGSGTVDVDDLVAVILAWGTGPGPADVDGSGQIDVDDLVTLILAWGPCPTG